MSLLSKVFGSPKATYRGVATQPEGCCYGKPLMPRWRGPQVMEDSSKAMGFVCHQCGREYLPYEVDAHRILKRRAP